MQTIGEKLEEARKRKGISIREAAETTKIRGDYLQKFEANSFELDLPPLYIRGFVRAYARYLDLDAERFVAEYDSAITAEGRSPRRENREVYGRVEFGEGGGETGNGGRSAQDQAMMLKFGLLGGGALLAVVLVIVLINVIFFRGPAKPAAPAPTPATAAATAIGQGENALTLTAKGPVRVKVVRLSTNQTLLDGLAPLALGDTRLVRYSDKLKVTVDDPSKLAMELNGRRVEVPIQQYGFFYIEP